MRQGGAGCRKVVFVCIRMWVWDGERVWAGVNVSALLWGKEQNVVVGNMGVVAVEHQNKGIKKQHGDKINPINRVSVVWFKDGQFGVSRSDENGGQIRLGYAHDGVQNSGHDSRCHNTGGCTSSQL